MQDRFDGVAVDLFPLLDPRHKWFHHGFRIFSHVAPHGPDNIVRRQLAAVVKHNILADLEGPLRQRVIG